MYVADILLRAVGTQYCDDRHDCAESRRYHCIHAVGQDMSILVAPNDPDNSYLIRKLENAATITGNRMPPAGAAISKANIDQIRLWINNGALR